MLSPTRKGLLDTRLFYFLFFFSSTFPEWRRAVSYPLASLCRRVNAYSVDEGIAFGADISNYILWHFNFPSRGVVDDFSEPWEVLSPNHLDSIFNCNVLLSPATVDVGVLLVFNVQELTRLSHNFGLEVRKSVAWSLYIALGIPKRQINSPTNLSATVEASRFGTPIGLASCPSGSWTFSKVRRGAWSVHMRSFGSLGNSSLIPMRQAVLSASHTDSNSSPLFNIRLAYATGCSTPSFTWLKTAPIPCLLAYVSAVNLVTTGPRLLKIRSSTGQMTTGTHMSRQSQHDLQLLVNEAVWSIEQN